MTAQPPSSSADDVDGVDEDVCVDARGDIHPEHDYPPVGEGSECRRCGAEAGDVDD